MKDFLHEIFGTKYSRKDQKKKLWKAAFENF